MKAYIDKFTYGEYFDGKFLLLDYKCRRR